MFMAVRKTEVVFVLLLSLPSSSAPVRPSFIKQIFTGTGFNALLALSMKMVPTAMGEILSSLGFIG